MKIDTNLIKKVKDANRIEDEISKKVELVRVGKEFVGAHHTHESKSGKSLKVSPAKQVYNCYSCSEGGDVIAWTRRTYNLSFNEAVEKLAAQANINIESSNFKISNTCDKDILEDIYLKAANFYHQQMTDKQKEVIFEKWGITSETIDKYKIGFAPTGGTALLEHLTSEGYSIEELLKSGLFIKSYKVKIVDFYQGRFVFPFWDFISTNPHKETNGVINYFIARKTKQTPANNWENAKYKKLLSKTEKHDYVSTDVKNKYFFCKHSLLDKNKIVIISEGTVDALAAIQNEFQSIALSTTNLSAEQKKEMLKILAGFSKIYICLDSDMAGQNGAIKIAEFFRDNDIEVKIIDLADDNKDQNTAEKVDLADYLKNNGKDKFIDKIKNAKSLLEFRLGQVQVADSEIDNYKLAKEFIATHLIKESDAGLVKTFISTTLKNKFNLNTEQTKDLTKDYVKDNQATDIKQIFNPKQLAEKIMSEYKFLYFDNQLHVYQDGVYKSNIADDIIKKAAIKMLGEDYRKNKVQEVEFYIKSVAKKAELNRSLDIINVKNGLLDWRTGELREHTADFHSNIQIPVTYDETATCPSVEYFLGSSFYAETRELIEELLGYILIPSTKFEKMFFLSDENGANGKSTFLKLISMFVGRDNTCSIPVQELYSNRFKRAELVGKLINTFADLSNASIEDSSYIKSLVTGDEIDAERKHQDPFFFSPFAKHVFSANIIPKANDRTNAFYRRLVIIPMLNRFDENNRDTNLIEKLTTNEELAGLLNIALIGLRRLMENNKFSEPVIVKQQLQRYRGENNNVEIFINESCELQNENEISKAYLYECYERWCELNKLELSSRIHFNRVLMSFGIQEKPRNIGARKWIGIDLVKEV